MPAEQFVLVNFPSLFSCLFDCLPVLSGFSLSDWQVTIRAHTNQPPIKITKLIVSSSNPPLAPPKSAILANAVRGRGEEVDQQITLAKKSERRGGEVFGGFYPLHACMHACMRCQHIKKWISLFCPPHHSPHLSSLRYAVHAWILHFS
ncbi:hypothetical protein BO82DRAFT_130271 [Aspergillus uvarum CBS 121591]|uniref:Uncharacterized protein n=1 Tax=Aspergillus uvarum CBS 121591 TaxID=1448315 RepID=A0A319CLW5_9EURO|nr:hypothetical protein BO82DRAFT_130271 [Aspergillus uvarum CBS 121591]PYH79653.1 hypothetical protein BO82DRAFT_130271 [Aspergillus uvarum CBS 121591]